MKKIITLLLCVTLVFSSVCFGVAAEAELPNIDITTEGFRDRLKSEFDLVFSDEFEGDKLDTSKWKYDSDAVFRNSEAQMYSNGEEDGNVYLKDGELVLQANKEYAINIDGKEKQYTSGEVSSLSAWKYGYFEIRAKIPCGNNTFPAIWMMGYDYKTGGCDWPHSGEIDIMEALGGTYTWSTLHHSSYGAYGSSSHKSTSAGRYENSDVQTEYHDFWLYWTDEIIVIGVDDAIFNIVDITTPELAQSFREYEHWLLLDLAMGPFGNTIKEADTDDWRFFIDYVRIYQPQLESIYDDILIYEAEETFSQNGSARSYALGMNTVTSSKLNTVACVVEDLPVGTYDVYASYIGQTSNNASVQNVFINDVQTAVLDTNSGASVSKGAQSKLGTVKIEQTKPFEIAFQYKSGKQLQMSVDKFIFVKTDTQEYDTVVNSQNFKNMQSEINVSTQSELIDALSRLYVGGTIKLASDITLTSTVELRNDMTIDLCGHTISSGALTNAFSIRKVTDITFKNGKVVVDGNSQGIFGKFINANEVYNTVVNFEDIDVTINAKKSNSTSSGVAFFGASYGSVKLNVTDCDFTITQEANTTNPILISYGLYSTYTNCTFNCSDGTVAPIRIYNGNSNNKGYLKINNCTVNNATSVFESVDAITSYMTVTLANINDFGDVTTLTNHDESVSMIIIETGNTAYDINSVKIDTLDNSADITVVCDHCYTEQTCTEDSICMYCGKFNKAAYGHTEGDQVTVNADCVNSGSISISCTNCNEVLSYKEIPRLEHNYQYKQTIQKGCKNDGYRIFECTLCSLEQTRSLYADGVLHKGSHTATPGKTTVIEPTCTSAGKHIDECSVCGDTYISRRFRNQHKLVATDTVVRATQTTVGYTLYKCTECDYTEKGDFVDKGTIYKYIVDIDGTEYCVEEDTYTLPKSDKAGFVAYTDGNNYYSEADTITLTKDVTLSTIAIGDVYMLSGAAVRLNEKTGLRWYTNLDVEAVSELKKIGATVETGTLIAYYDRLENELTFDAKQYTDNNELVWSNVPFVSDAYYVEESSAFKGVVGSLVDFRQEHIITDFVARGYVKVTIGDYENIVYARYSDDNISNNIRTVKYVASKAAQDDNFYPRLSDKSKKLIDYWASYSED